VFGDHLGDESRLRSVTKPLSKDKETLSSQFTKRARSARRPPKEVAHRHKPLLALKESGSSAHSLQVLAVRGGEKDEKRTLQDEHKSGGPGWRQVATALKDRDKLLIRDIFHVKLDEAVTKGTR
jgi:hypothetical protein